MGVAAMVLGILAVVLFWIPAVGWLGVLMGLVALILGIAAMRKANKGLGLVGIVLGSVGLIGGLIVQILVIFAADAAIDQIEQHFGAQGDDAARISDKPFD